MVNWISAFKDCRKTDIKGFARVAGDRKVCIPAGTSLTISIPRSLIVLLMDGTNMSVSTYPMYGISKPFAALSCSQVLSLCNLSFGSKFLLKNDSGMNVISQCAELLQKQMGPSYLKQIECDETMVNWVSAFKD
jgi:hypothetical protein